MHSSYKTLNFRHSIANKSKREKYRRKDRKIDNTKIDRQTIPRQIDRQYQDRQIGIMYVRISHQVHEEKLILQFLQ